MTDPNNLLPNGQQTAPSQTAEPAAEAAPRTGGGLSLAALIVAIVGLIVAAIPFATFGSGAFLVTAVVLAIVALIRRSAGKGRSIAALAVAVAGWVLSVVMIFVSIGIAGGAARDAINEATTGTGPAVTTEDDAEQDDAPAAADAQDLVIVETAFGRDLADTWWYTVILDNPNPDHVFDFAEITVEAIGADGAILDSSSDYRTVLAGRTAVTGSFLSIGTTEIASLEVRAPEASSALSSAADETGVFSVEGLSASSDSYSTAVRGMVGADFENKQELVEVVVVARNGAGQIIDSGFDLVDRLPADGTKVQFEVTFFDVLPGDTTYEAYPAL